jgi:hypothetical protein
MLHRTMDLDGFFGMILAKEKGYEIWNVECKRFV